ncbi:hypothetical protein JCM10212_004177 [Sporobolomyces blumeae]
MAPRNAPTLKLSLDPTPLALPALLKLLTSTPHLDMSKAIALAAKLVPAGYTSHFKLRTLTGVDLAKIGVADEETRKAMLLALGKAGAGSDKGKAKAKPARPEFGDEGATRRKRGRESDLDQPLPTKHDKGSEVEQDLDFDEIEVEEALVHKACIVNRAPVMTAWATVVAEHLGFSRQEALSIAHVFTNLNATSKGVALGIKPASELEEEIGASQPFVELLGRKVPVLSTQSSGWRALSNGAVAEPSKAFAYVQSAFRQQMGAVIGAMRLLANSFEPNELNRKGYGLYLDFRPDSDGWGKKAELKMSTILDLRRFLTHPLEDVNPGSSRAGDADETVERVEREQVKAEEGDQREAEGEQIKHEEGAEPETKRVKLEEREEDLKPELLIVEPSRGEQDSRDEFDALLDQDDGIDFSAIEGV